MPLTFEKEDDQGTIRVKADAPGERAVSDTLPVRDLIEQIAEAAGLHVERVGDALVVTVQAISPGTDPTTPEPPISPEPSPPPEAPPADPTAVT